MSLHKMLGGAHALGSASESGQRKRKMRVCQRCNAPIQSGRGKKWCSPCYDIKRHERMRARHQSNRAPSKLEDL